jgi:Protein of unknown function (DUF3105)
LAKKVRTPAPPAPRRVQAPKKRTGPRHPAAGQQRNRLPLLLAAAGAVAVIGAIVAGVLVFGGGSGSDVPQMVRDAGGTYRVVEARDNFRQGKQHVESLPKGFKYNTNPPTSGMHYPLTIVWGMYDAPVDRLRSVHNLEHGGVMIHYGDRVPPGTVDQLAEFFRDDPNGLVIAPLPSLGNKISLAAWTFDLGRLNDRDYKGEGHLALLPRFDEDVFRAFVDEYRFKGPERFAPEDLTPGNA